MRKIVLCLLALLMLSCGTNRALEQYLRTAEAYGFDGQVVAERDGRVIVDRALGFADREHGRRATRATQYGIASQTKQFTATAILLLEQQGRLHTTDTIAQFLDGVPDDKKDITIHQLLTHTSGLPPGDLVGDFEAKSAAQLIGVVLAAPRKTPGEWRYSNAGFNLLAAIIEKASGAAYETFLREQLFRPAGMTRTGVIGADRIAEGAVAYRGLIPQSSIATWPRNWRTWGGGDVFSTAEDLEKWEQALRGDRILNAAQKGKLFAPYVKVGEGDTYGYAWFVDGKTSRGTRLIEHGGDTELGFNCAFRRFPDEHASLLVTSNRTDVNGPWLRWRIQGDLERLMFGQKAEASLPEPRRAALPPAGTYRAADGAEIEVSTSGGQLVVAARNAAAAIALFGAEADAPALLQAVDKTRKMLASPDENGFATALTEEAKKFAGDYVNEWRDIVAKHGAVKGFTIAGAVPRGKNARVFVELATGDGAFPITYGWADKGAGRLNGSTPGDGPPLARVFTPIAAGRYAAAILGTNNVVTMQRENGALRIGSLLFARAR